jgi:hypothetical protein
MSRSPWATGAACCPAGCPPPGGGFPPPPGLPPGFPPPGFPPPGLPLGFPLLPPPWGAGWVVPRPLTPDRVVVVARVVCASC